MRASGQRRDRARQGRAERFRTVQNGAKRCKLVQNGTARRNAEKRVLPCKTRGQTHIGPHREAVPKNPHKNTGFHAPRAALVRAALVFLDFPPPLLDDFVLSPR